LTEAESWADADTRLDVLFDRVLLTDVRRMVRRFSRSAYSGLAELAQPSPPTLRVVKAVVLLVEPELNAADMDWSHCQAVSSLR